MSDTNKTPATHVATMPNKRPPTEIEVFRENLQNEDFQNAISTYFNGRESEKLIFITSTVDYVRAVPKLLECNRVSLMSAFAKVAAFGFMPSTVLQEAHIIPYGSEAKFQLGYQGIVTLLYRTGKISTISANIIYTNDTFSFQEGLNADLQHRPAFGKAKGEPIGVYTIAQMADGSKTFKVMDKDAIMEIKELSKAKNSKESPWNSDKDPEMWMWKKTCLIQHAKLLPKSRELVQALEADFDSEGIEKSTLDPAGVAVGRALHTPDPVDVTPME